MEQVDLLESHYVVCTGSHIVRRKGGVKQNLVALVSFFSFAFSSDVNPADPLYSLRRGSPLLPHLFGCHGYEVSLSLVKLKCVFLSRGLLMANILDYCY